MACMNTAIDFSSPRAVYLTALHVLPVQFHSNARRRLLAAPEHQLMAAVLEDAIRVYQKLRVLHGRAGRKMRRELHEWFLAADDRWLFSFRNCCDILDINAESVLDQLGLRASEQRQ